MSDGPPRLPGSPPTESGSLQFLWFDGLLESSVEGAPALDRCALELGRLGLTNALTRRDGGRATLLLDDGTLSGVGFDDPRRTAVFETLNQLVAELPGSGPVHSTLRCTEVFAGDVRETLFGTEGRELRAIARRRGVTDADRDRAPRDVADARAKRRTRRVVVLSVLAAIVVTAWMDGIHEVPFAPEASQLALESGAFDGLLELSLDSTLLGYEVHLARGLRYPESSADLQQLKDDAQSPAIRAAIDVVARSADVTVVLEDSSGVVLAQRSLRLAALAANARAPVIHFRKRLHSARIRLQLTGER